MLILDHYASLGWIDCTSTLPEWIHAISTTGKYPSLQINYLAENGVVDSESIHSGNVLVQLITPSLESCLLGISNQKKAVYLTVRLRKTAGVS